jgi:hypothetical protein
LRILPIAKGRLSMPCITDNTRAICALTQAKCLDTSRTHTRSYYLYMWDLVIAQDFFHQFDKNNLLGKKNR